MNWVEVTQTDGFRSLSTWLSLLNGVLGMLIILAALWHGINIRFGPADKPAFVFSTTGMKVHLQAFAREKERQREFTRRISQAQSTQEMIDIYREFYPYEEPHILIPELIERFDSLTHLECDGMSRLLSHHLTLQQVPHRCYVGSVLWRGRLVKPHYWIQLRGKRDFGDVLDLRLRMWLGPEAPHGVFAPEEQGVSYARTTKIDLTTPASVLDILTEPWPPELRAQLLG